MNKEETIDSDMIADTSRENTGSSCMQLTSNHELQLKVIEESRESLYVETYAHVPSVVVEEAGCH